MTKVPPGNGAGKRGAGKRRHEGDPFADLRERVRDWTGARSNANRKASRVELRDMGDELTRPDLHPLFSLLVYTGVRRGEALGLRWSDVDLERRMITVRRSYDGQTKSSKQRTVPLPSALTTILKAYRLADPWQGDLCFPNREGEMYSRNAKVEALFHDALTRAGLPRIRVHDLRHVFASHFVMGGGDVFTLQRILGHSTPQLTSDTYAHLSPGHMVGAADRVSYPEPERTATLLRFEPLASIAQDSS